MRRHGGVARSRSGQNEGGSSVVTWAPRVQVRAEQRTEGQETETYGARREGNTGSERAFATARRPALGSIHFRWGLGCGTSTSTGTSTNKSALLNHSGIICTRERTKALDSNSDGASEGAVSNAINRRLGGR